jgi:DNA-directed RNA polymerase specialized sigma24 family protein
MDNKEIYSDKLTKGRRTYFFDINKSEKGDLYLKVSESKKTESGFEHHRIIVFEEDIKDFSEAFEKVLTKFKELKDPKQTDGKAYSVEKIREAHKQAYLPWTPEDDSKLELLFCEGKKVKELAQIFGRNDGAISSRIKKLELKEKYEPKPRRGLRS